MRDDTMVRAALVKKFWEAGRSVCSKRGGGECGCGYLDDLVDLVVVLLVRLG